jgi:hypothetical protein
MDPRPSVVEEFGPEVDVVSDCGFSGAVEFASLRISGFFMLCMHVGTRPRRPLLITSHVQAGRTQTGPARRSS